MPALDFAVDTRKSNPLDLIEQIVEGNDWRNDQEERARDTQRRLANEQVEEERNRPGEEQNKDLLDHSRPVE